MDLIDIYREFVASADESHLGQRFMGAMVEAGETDIAKMKTAAKPLIDAELSKAIAAGKTRVELSDDDIRFLVKPPKETEGEADGGEIPI
jgi:hypothetical protein